MMNLMKTMEKKLLNYTFSLCFQKNGTKKSVLEEVEWCAQSLVIPKLDFITYSTLYLKNLG